MHVEHFTRVGTIDCNLIIEFKESFKNYVKLRGENTQIWENINDIK